VAAPARSSGVSKSSGTRKAAALRAFTSAGRSAPRGPIGIANPPFGAIGLFAGPRYASLAAPPRWRRCHPEKSQGALSALQHIELLADFAYLFLAPAYESRRQWHRLFPHMLSTKHIGTRAAARCTSNGCYVAAGYRLHRIEPRAVRGLPAHYTATAEPPALCRSPASSVPSGSSPPPVPSSATVARAYYAEGADYVRMPPFETFQDAESYAATPAHGGDSLDLPSELLICGCGLPGGFCTHRARHCKKYRS
jgi:hypothetical protein